MALLQDQDREALRQEFEAMKGRVRLVFFSQALGCDTCGITEQILDEIAPLSDKIQLVKLNYAIDRDSVRQYNITRIPAFAVVGEREITGADGEHVTQEHDYGIRFYGVPSGYEFMALIGAILDVSSGDSQLSPESRALIAEIREPAHIQVFTTPT